MIEYVPVKVGFGTTAFETSPDGGAGRITRNDKPLDLKIINCNAAETKAQTAVELQKIKDSDSNAVWVDYPQPFWFYDLCDALGLYVIDQANIHCANGAVNDPRLVEYFTDRVETAFRRSAGHVCIVAWSLGGRCGNGYCMYRAYQALKALGDSRPVVYRDAGGQWNTDIMSIQYLQNN
jgi:beta-galactosidase